MRLQPPNGKIWVIRFRAWQTTITIRWHQHNIILSIMSPLFPALPFPFNLPVRRSYLCSLHWRKLNTLSFLKTPFRRWIQCRATRNNRLFLLVATTPQPPWQTCQRDSHTPNCDDFKSQRVTMVEEALLEAKDLWKNEAKKFEKRNGQWFLPVAETTILGNDPLIH